MEENLNDTGTSSLGSEDNTGIDSSSTFSIPEEYSQKSWAKSFQDKTGDELKNEFFKSFDNAQTLISKRVDEYVGNADLSTLETFDNIKDLIQNKSANVPENIEDYNLSSIYQDENGESQFEFSDDILNKFSTKFKDLNLSVEQAQGLLKFYTDFELENFEQYANPEELKNEISSLFGSNESQRKNVEGLLNEFLDKDDANFLKTSAPNRTIMMFYKLAKGLSEKYDYKEGNSNAGVNRSNLALSDAEKEKRYDEVFDKLMTLKERPHTDEEHKELVRELNSIWNK